MSYQRAPRDDSAFFKLPDGLQLPLYSSVRGYSIRDDALSERVQRALLEDYKNANWISKPAAEEHRRWRRCMQSLRVWLAAVLSHVTAFSLGALVSRYRE